MISATAVHLAMTTDLPSAGLAPAAAWAANPNQTAMARHRRPLPTHPCRRTKLAACGHPGSSNARRRKGARGATSKPFLLRRPASPARRG